MPRGAKSKANQDKAIIAALVRMKQELVNPDPTIQDQDSSAELFGGDIMHHLSRTTLAAAAISWGSIAAAFAADLGSRPAYKAMPIATVYDWTGLYIGGHVGWASADRTFEPTNILGVIVNPGFRQNSNGFLGGGQVGFNQQTGNWVWGLEADISGTDLRRATTVAMPTLPLLTQTYDVSIDWTASLTGRVGYAWDRWMLYGKGGAATMQETYRLAAPGLLASDPSYRDAKVTRLGWTVGAGVENAFLDNWSWKAEYNYMRFDANDSISNLFSVNTFGAATSRTDVNIHAVKAGINYRFGGPVLATGIRQQPVYKAAPAAAVYDWTGLYVGAHAGWAGVEREFQTTFRGGVVFTPGFTQNASGFSGGGQVGFNRQAGNWIMGLEADIAGTRHRARSSVIDPAAIVAQTFDVKIDWMGILTGRLGYSWGRWMLYGKGGAALMHETYALTIPIFSPRNDAEVTRLGWTAGAGIENAFLDNWSWKAEYNYLRFDNIKTVSNTSIGSNANGIASEANVDVHAVKLGINYRLGNYGGVAKY